MAGVAEGGVGACAGAGCRVRLWLRPRLFGGIKSSAKWASRPRGPGEAALDPGIEGPLEGAREAGRDSEAARVPDVPRSGDGCLDAPGEAVPCCSGWAAWCAARAAARR